MQIISIIRLMEGEDDKLKPNVLIPNLGYPLTPKVHL